MAYVDYAKSGHIVTITLNRPERRNSMSRELMEDYADAWDKFVADDDAWVAVMTGAGTAFCAGNDLKDAKERGSFSGQHRMTYPFMPNTDKPTISAVNGFAMGGGFVMACSTDFGVVAEDAILQLTEIQLGVIGGFDLGLRNRVPVRIAKEMSLLGLPFTGRRAYEVGLFNRCVPRDQVVPEAMKLAERIVNLPPLTVRAMMQAMSKDRPWASDAAWAVYHGTKDELAKAEDTLEAVRAFNEKRPPVFKGR